MLAAIAAVAYAAWYVSTPIPIPKPVEVEIQRGSRVRVVAAQLEKAGIPVRRVEFEVLARILRRERAIKAGSYEFSGALTPMQLLDKLTRGDVTQAEVRLIEGWTFAQFRTALNDSPYLRHDSRDLSEAAILALLHAPETHAEGLFFPDTYLFAKGSSDLAVLKRAYGAMQRHLDVAWKGRAEDLPYSTPYAALIMASIVEKETGQAEERRMIAGVLVNRLRIGMHLQVDPTVIYGLGTSFDGNLTKKHLMEDAPYNTYTRAGLPPTPIAMPGIASLDAALHPEKTDALYYVSRGDGSSQFSRTLQEHNRAVSRYQRNGR